MNKTMYFKILLFFVLLLSISVVNIFAQETSDKQYFDIQYEIGRQSVWTNSIPIDIYITPHSDYDRVEITFSHGTMIDAKYSGPQFFPVKKSEIYHIRGKIIPKEKGTHQITINAIAWEYDTNYTSSEAVKVQIDEKLQIVPQTQAYKILNVLKTIFIILIILSIVVGLYFAGIKNKEKIIKWFEPKY